MHIRFELQFFKRSDIQHIPFVESIFPFIIIIILYINFQIILSYYLEIEIMILIICFEELISTFNDKFRSIFFLKIVSGKTFYLSVSGKTFYLSVSGKTFYLC